MASSQRPGIEALEVYFPAQYVDQTQLEIHNGVSQGKYTIGLGQSKMAFATDLENTHTLALSVVSNLMKKANVGYEDIGRLTVASETLVDKSKSIKSVLMSLFQESGNFDVEGVDYLNACYAGTASLFDAINWIQSEDWDGRRALVVCVDIAEYEDGPARPTGGAGAVAMLIGPDPTIHIERGRTSFMKHAYDFYKPYLSSPYPVVDGKVSNQCYLEALDKCYAKFVQLPYLHQPALDDWDYFVFHSPYNKLVQKSFGRLFYNDFLVHPETPQYAHLQEFLTLEPSETYNHKGVYKSFVNISKEDYNKKVAPSTVLPKAIGNCYTASVYTCLASLIVESETDALRNKRVLAFSYGSGLCSSMFHLKFSDDVEKLEQLKQNTDYTHRLEDRLEFSPEAFNQVLSDKCQINEFEDYVPQHLTTNLYPGSYFLTQRLSNGQYTYEEYDGTMEECRL